MPQLIALMVAGAGLYAGYKWLAKEVGRAAEEMRRATAEMERRASGEPKDLGPLEPDPADGVYRPVEVKSRGT